MQTLFGVLAPCDSQEDRVECRATYLVQVFDGDLEASQDLPWGWVLRQGQLEPGLGSTFSIEHRWVVVEVHDSDGDRDRGLGSGASCSADLSHLGWGQVPWFWDRLT